MEQQTSLNLRNLADMCSEILLGDKLAWEKTDNFDEFIAQVKQTLQRGLNKAEFSFVCSTEYFYNCPVHDGGVSGDIKLFASLDEIKEYAIEGLNEHHVDGIESLVDESEYVIEYQSAGHSYVSIKLFKDDKLISQTRDNGSGTLYWDDVED